MKFDFPKDKKTETLNISIYEKDIKKVRKLAEVNTCTINDIYKTIISEALEDYEEKFGAVEAKEAKKQYSVKRDYVEAGDNKRKEVLQGEEFDGGGDLRTKESKKPPNCKECGINEITYPRFGLCSTCYFQTKNKGETPEKLPKNWYKKENLVIKEEPKNLGVVAYCHYILCPTKKYNRDDGIEADGKNFCSSQCHDRFIESFNANNDISQYSSPASGTIKN